MPRFFNKEKIKEFGEKEKLVFTTLIKWCIASSILGVGLGFTGVLFYKLLHLATEFRLTHTWVLFLLPFAGLLIVWLYNASGEGTNSGTNVVLSAIQAGEKLPFRVAPLVFISTIITHMFGGSSGREGAALQIGGAIGNWAGGLFKLDEKDKHVLIMCGMSACFSALFGTPAAAAIFSLEVISVGVMYYAALVPCVLSALIAKGIVKIFDVEVVKFDLGVIPNIDFPSGLKLIVMGAIFAGVSVLFIIALQSGHDLFSKYLKNPYVRIFVAGWMIVGLSFILRTNDYLGASSELIGVSIVASSAWYVFILKIIFTAITLGSGFKGGEIVPSLVIGATLGSFLAPIFHMPLPVCVACGMVSVFCGVTNSPITSFVLSIEMFGTGPMYYCIISIAISYLLSEYYSLYKSQKIVYSKYKTTYINRKCK